MLWAAEVAIHCTTMKPPRISSQASPAAARGQSKRPSAMPVVNRMRLEADEGEDGEQQVLVHLDDELAPRLGVERGHRVGWSERFHVPILPPLGPLRGVGASGQRRPISVPTSQMARSGRAAVEQPLDGIRGSRPSSGYRRDPARRPRWRPRARRAGRAARPWPGGSGRARPLTGRPRWHAGGPRSRAGGTTGGRTPWAARARSHGEATGAPPASSIGLGHPAHRTERRPRSDDTCRRCARHGVPCPPWRPVAPARRP